MIHRRRFLLTSLAGALAAPLEAAAQQARAKKPARVGHLDSVRGATPTWDSFVEALREAGWVEGRDVIFERRFSEGRAEQFPSLAEELVRAKVDIIVTSYTPAAHAAKQATATIPIVMVGAGDPTGLVASFSRPGGNITGVTALTLELGPKLLQFLKELKPAAARVAYVLQGTLVHRERLWNETHQGARAMGLELLPVIVHDSQDLTPRLDAMLHERPDAVVVHGGPLVVRHIADVIAFTAAHKLPTVYDNGAFVRRGALISYGASFTDLARRAAGYADKILKGAKPADLPIEQPTTFELVINLKTAKALALTIPPSLLARADQVIE